MQRYFVEPYRFVPPYRGKFWCWIGSWYASHALRDKLQITRLEFRGQERLQESLSRRAGILLTPNHSRYGDGLVLGMVGLRLRQYFYYVVSYHMFKQPGSLAWWLNRFGCYSIHREGTDRESIRASARILAAADRPIILFPEGTWYRQNDRINLLQPGVGLIARQAVRQANRPILIHPVAIKYWVLEDPRSRLHQRLERLEARLSWHPQRQLDLVQRLEKIGGGYLAIKEIEHFGQAQSGELIERLHRLTESHVLGAEKLLGIKVGEDSGMMERIRRLRQILVRRLQETADAEEQRKTLERLDDLLLCENLLASDPEYLYQRLSLERLTEAVQRLDEGVTDQTEEPVVPLGAVVEIGPPLDVREFPRQRGAAHADGDPLTQAIAAGVQGMLDRMLAEGPPPAWNCPPPIEAVSQVRSDLV
jgi:1-acyl-sn-glycerol-3-phosphate acyltransferase